MASVQLPVEGELPSFGGATGWLYSPPLTPAGLRGKVVIAGLWTYTCINWLRQLPYLRAWAEKYSAHGLVVIGVHTPEFSFEHHPETTPATSAPRTSPPPAEMYRASRRGLHGPRHPPTHSGRRRTAIPPRNASVLVSGGDSGGASGL